MVARIAGAVGRWIGALLGWPAPIPHIDSPPTEHTEPIAVLEPARPVAATAPARPAQNFRLAARLCSAAKLNPPKQRLKARRRTRIARATSRPIAVTRRPKRTRTAIRHVVLTVARPAQSQPSPPATVVKLSLDRRTRPTTPLLKRAA